ncbi:MAG: endonuclease/exonuclease/phosphatase family protein, partial [Actinomycetota bacterium]|nr:endonuclease/exonuclease/phosphatase family protein [Actinomycetota bacterium]
LSARRRDGSQVAEFNAAQRDVTATRIEHVVEAVVPRGTTFLSARVKFHTSTPGESGEGEIERMELRRLASPTRLPEGPRVSLYNFNIHKMRDDWRGWITYIVQQKLAPPDVVLLQDVAHDEDRELLQTALGEAFGGTWAGVGSDPEWQTAVVWRTRRFTKPLVRRWRGFGGRSCVDHSQDAPAVQVKLYHRAADKWVSLVSLKTPPGVSDSCAWSNIQKVHQSFEPPWSGHLCVIGTDANAPDRDAAGQWLPWYQRTVASAAAALNAPETLGYIDPVADAAGVDPEQLADHATHGKTRIDFLLLRAPWNEPPRVVRQMTLPRGDAAGVRWSDHRGLHAEVAY